jgi:hypothetical protein
MTAIEQELAEVTKPDELRDAETEHDAAHRAWRSVRERQQLLAGHGVVEEGSARRRLDEVEREIVAGELGREREMAARRLADARSRLQELRVAHANEVLPVLRAEHERSSARVEVARGRMEHAYAELLDASWDFADAHTAELRVTRRVIAAAEAAAGDDEMRAGIKHSARAGDLVAKVGSDGQPEEYTARPPRELFEGTGARSDPSEVVFWEGLCRQALAGRDKAPMHVGEQVLAAIDGLEMGEVDA